MSDSDSESDILNLFKGLSVREEIVEMNPEQIAQIVQSAVSGALAAQSAAFEEKLKALATQVENVVLTPVAPQVAVFEPVEITSRVKCEESLDIIKSLPTFSGTGRNVDEYVSWRQAAHNAYKVFESYDGTSAHYQAVAILRNKITGVADATLTSYSTPLNFKAIIWRLDKAYSDKRPIYLMEQELSTLRQGNKSVGDYYDEVQKVLSSLTNKTVMNYDEKTAASFNEKYRQDALRVFISGLRKNLSETIFAARPSDLPSALAYAEELESNRERYAFASNFGNNGNETAKGSFSRRPLMDKQPPPKEFRNNPNYIRRDPVDQAPVVVRKDKDPVEPMDVDRTDSSRFRFNPKRQLSGRERFSDRNRQRVNHIDANDLDDEDECEEEDYYAEYAERTREPPKEIDEDHINFLEEGPSYPM